jgi:hypothetical protein
MKKNRKHEVVLNSFGDLPKLYQMAIRAMEEIDHPDFQNWGKIGILNKDGRVKALKYTRRKSNKPHGGIISQNTEQTKGE